MSGLSIYNSSGSIIISESYRNYHLASSGTIANSGSLPTVPTGHILCVRPTTAGALIYASTTGGSYIKVNTGSIEWALFRIEIPASSETYGLRVFTPSGTIAYDSGIRSMLPVSLSRLAQSVNGSTVAVTQPFAPSAIRKRYVLASSFRITGLADSGAEQAIFRQSGITWTNDTSMTLREGVLVAEFGPIVTNFSTWAPSMPFGFIDA